MAEKSLLLCNDCGRLMLNGYKRGAAQGVEYYNGPLICSDCMTERFHDAVAQQRMKRDGRSNEVR